MSVAETTNALLKRRDKHKQIYIWNLDRDAPGSQQSAEPVDEDLTEGLIAALERYVDDNTLVDTIAMTTDLATVILNDPRGIDGSATLQAMARDEKNGHITYSGRDREILDKCYNNPELFKQPKDGRPPSNASGGSSGSTDEDKAYLATYNVSPIASEPHSCGHEVRPCDLLQCFVEELKRVKDKGVVVSASYNGETAVVTVDAPGGL